MRVVAVEDRIPIMSHHHHTSIVKKRIQTKSDRANDGVLFSAASSRDDRAEPEDATYPDIRGHPRAHGGFAPLSPPNGSSSPKESWLGLDKRYVCMVWSVCIVYIHMYVGREKVERRGENLYVQ